MRLCILILSNCCDKINLLFFCMDNDERRILLKDICKKVTGKKVGGVFFDLRKSDLLARGLTAVIWTCGRSARPPSMS